MSLKALHEMAWEICEHVAESRKGGCVPSQYDISEIIRADRLALLDEIERLGKPVTGSSNGSWRAAVDMLRAEIEAGE